MPWLGVVPSKTSRGRRFLGQNVGIGEIVGFFEAFIAEPEDIEAGFVAVRSLIHLFKPNPNAFPLLAPDIYK